MGDGKILFSVLAEREKGGGHTPKLSHSFNLPTKNTKMSKFNFL